MRKYIILFLTFVAINNFGYSTDSLKIVSLQREVSNLKVSVSRLQQENGKIRGLYQQQKNNVDSLLLGQKQQAENLNILADKVGIGLSETNKSIQDSKDLLSSSINTRTWLAVCGILIALALLGIVYSILKKSINSGSSTIDKIKSAQESLEKAQKVMQEESIKLDSKLVELLEKQITTVPKQEDSTKIDHSFALKVGDEIAKIETNLSKMDPEVKGYKQLKQALKRIKDNFNAHGYEIVELLGLDYNDGMPFETQFVPDESLPEGKRIISGITRLQINYNGEMIQSAKIVVRQNI
jgi:hypothetical protein